MSKNCMFHATLMRYFGLLVFFGTLGWATPNDAKAQIDVDRFLGEFNESTDIRDKVSAIRALSVSVVRQQATDEQRTRIIEFLKQNIEHENAVIRLTIHVELFKIGVAENDVVISQLAMKAADDENINVRRGILKYFRTYYAGRFEVGEPHSELLLKKLDDEDLEIRYHAAAVMHSWGLSNNKVVDVLLEALDLTNYRAAIVHSLVSTEKNRPATIAKIVDRLEKSEHNAAQHINLLSMMMPESKSAIGQILDCFSSEQPQVRVAVVDAIGRMNLDKKRSIETLLAAVQDPAAPVRELVIPSLARFQPDRQVFVNTVLKLLVDDNEQVAQVAGKCIGYFEDDFEYLVPHLSEIFASDKQEAIKNVLSGLMACGPMAGAVFPDVVKLFDHKNYEIRMHACWALLEITTDQRDPAINALNELIDRETEEPVRTIALQTLSQFEPTNENSGKQFFKYMNDENQFVRYACIYGLKPFVSSENAEQILKIPSPGSQGITGQLGQFDNRIVDALLSGGNTITSLVAKYLDDKDPFVRSRAIRVVGESSLANDEPYRAKIIKALESEHATINFSAAHAVANLEKMDKEILDKIFDLTDTNKRQRTSDILQLFAEMGQKAAPIAPRIAGLMNGEYRGRYLNDAKQAIIKMGPHAHQAIPELTVIPLTIPKLECIWAIGKKDQQAETSLRNFIEEMNTRISSNRNVNQVSVDRRNRLYAAVALAQAADDPTVAAKTIREELNSKLRPVALRMIEKVYLQDESLIHDLINCLPEQAAIETLSSIGSKAASAVPQLEQLVASPNREIANRATQALWNIQNNPELAIETLNKIMEDNRSEPIEIKLEHRQMVWQILRFLANKHGSNPKAQDSLQRIEISRFANLRSFVKNLRTN